MNNILSGISIALMLAAVAVSCKSKMTGSVGDEGMAKLLSDAAKSEFDVQNPFSAGAQLAYYDSVLNNPSNESQARNANYQKAIALLKLGDEKQAINLLEALLKAMKVVDFTEVQRIRRDLAIAYLRLGERNNCIHNHSPESCVFPIQGAGVHTDKNGSLKAKEILELLLKESPNDLESRWLLNIACMTIGTYPGAVPPQYLIKGLGANTSPVVKPFQDCAVNIRMNKRSMGGGSIVDDFNNDGYLDIVTSSWGLKESMHYATNNSLGAFVDVSQQSGLINLTGGLNIMQTDYNNDGFKDIFVLRGAWKGRFGKDPNSLLRNNGDGTFTDVTAESGLLSFHPTQTATWNDFNNDGWLDVFIGNESAKEEQHPCELYINNKNGSFTNVALQSGTNIIGFVKGVTSGDYNNDGLPDIFLSTMGSKKYLLQNEGVQNGMVHFKDATQQAGLANFSAATFPTWFWDYDNDGWLDILVCGYEFDRSLAWYAAGEALGMPMGNAGQQFLFRNKHDGTFENISEKVGLNKIAFAMGSNFGDIDNDGWLDIYLGTGNPEYQSLLPNKCFKNMGGKSFADITSSARLGNLQKGHGVSFADLDNDGDEDIFIEMGGAYPGDAYENSLYVNPGQNNNHWISLKLEGTKCNKAAIGAKLKVTFKENGVERSVYRDVNSGGSFGSNPLVQHIGIGKAVVIESIEIKWPVSNTVQVFKKLQADEYISIKEGNPSFIKKVLNKADFTAVRFNTISCYPM